MLPILLAILAGLCWGIGELCTKAVLHTGQVGPITAIAVRATVALPAIWIAYVVARHVLKVPGEQPSWTQAETGTLLKLILGSGLCAGAAAMIFFYAALSLDDISRVKPIAFTIAPAAAVILARLVLHEDVTPRKWIAVAMILAGVALLASTKPTATTPAHPAPAQSPE
jgi:drug/metabolite transporter (DMT)-like permease